MKRLIYRIAIWLSRWFPGLNPWIEKEKWKLLIGKPTHSPMTTVRFNKTDEFEKEKQRRLYDELLYGPKKEN
jgi:hypothetical protein